MKYYGKITDPKDLVTKEKSTEIAQQEIASSSVVSGKIDNPQTKSTGQILEYNGTNWVAADKPTSGIWGQITGTLSDQTDLQTALNGKEATSNKVTTISASSTDTEYPSAKCVYDYVQGSIADAIGGNY